MDGCERNRERQKEAWRFNQKQYKFLKECAEEGTEGIKKWNEKRMNNPGEEILLEGEEALFDNWYLQKVNLRSAHLRGAQFWGTKLQGADFTDAHLEGADLRGAYLRGAILFKTHFEDAVLWSSHLEEANLKEVHLEGANLQDAHLEGTYIHSSYLEGANFNVAYVDSSTEIWRCSVDRHTDFQGVVLDTVRIDPAIKQLLEYNIRRKNWEEWYKEHSRLKWLVKPFWWISDYGLRSWRIIVTFFGLAIAFGVVYWLCPSCVIVMGEVGDIRGFWHALYFSVVTMTTLGFGDIAANPDSWAGQTLLMLQVILGYVLLGALVTRFAVLFTAGGPAGKFSKEKKE